MSKIAATALAALALAAGLWSCGDGGGDSSDASAAIELPRGHDAVALINDWVETLSEGDVEAAADYFALPSIVQNGTPPLELETRAEVVTFNRSLPCGAELVAARRRGRFIAATFLLTERPGPGVCGAGVGGLARTAFLIRDGEIVQWRRLPDSQPEEGPGGPVV